MFGGKSQKAVCRSAWAAAGEPPRFSATPGEGGRGAHPETSNETAPTYQRAPWMIGREPGHRLPLLHDTAYTALKLHKLPARQNGNTTKSMTYSAKCRLCRICKIDEAIENTSFLRNCMNMHSIQHRKQPRKVHQYAPDHRRKTSHHKPHDFFICRHNAKCMGQWAISSSHLGYKIIISSSSYHHHCITGAQPGPHAKRGGL